MKNINKASLIAMILITILSFTNLFGLNISSACIFIGIAFFFINKRIEKESAKTSSLDIKGIESSLKNIKIWFWLPLPIVMNTICILISISFLPEYIKYETARAGAFVPIEISITSILLFFVFALGEEIAWRSFFQKQLSKLMSFIPVLIFSSILFTLGHFEQGNLIIVVYGLLFTFINSILYGIIFHKTNNAWVSAIAHFASNIFTVIVFVLL